MQFKSLLLFFNMKDTNSALVVTKFRDLFSIALEQDDISTIDKLISDGHQLSFEQKEIFKQKLIDLTSYLYPRNFYQQGIRINSNNTELLLENVDLTELNLMSHHDEYNKIASIEVSFELKHLLYFQIISKYDILDDFIIEQIQTKNGIAQFFNIISGINMFYCDNIQLPPLHKYTEHFKNTFNSENSTQSLSKLSDSDNKIKQELYIKNKVLKKIILDISRTFENNYLNNNLKLKRLDKEEHNSIINSVIEQYPISHLSRMSFLSFLTPTILNNIEDKTKKVNEKPSAEEKTILTLRNDNISDINFYADKVKNDKIISTLDKTYTDINYLSKNIYKRICLQVSMEQGETILHNILCNNHLFSYCLLSNIFNNFSNFNISYNVNKGEKILKAINIIKKRKPHILIKNTLIESIENQILLSNSIIQYFSLHNLDIVEKESSALKESESIEKSNLDVDVKNTLLEIVKMKDNIIANNILNDNELIILNNFSKKIKQIINLTHLASDSNDVLDYIHTLYEELFTFDYSFLKKTKTI